MSSETKKIVKPWQAMLMLATGIAVIIIGLLVLKAQNRVVLAIGGVILATMAWAFGIEYNEIQKSIKDTITSMIVAMLILLAVGTLVASWMAAGTVPMMIYYGMKIITPGLFLPIVCLLCTFMSTCAGTSWGTLATVGVACMGVAEGLGVPAGAAAGAICVGAFFGDKVSPLSDSPVITSSVCDTDMMEGIKHSLITTGPAWIISMIFFVVYGLQFGDGTVGGEVYNDILTTVEANFNLSIITLIPVVVVIALIMLKKPTIPTFVAGIVVACIIAMAMQGMDFKTLLATLYSGYAGDSGSATVDSMLNRGGLSSMNSTILLLMAAAIFGAPLKAAGVLDILLDWMEKTIKGAKTMSLGCTLIHALFFVITGAYYVTYPVVGGMVKDMYPKYGLEKKNLMRSMLDTGTGFAPLVPWSTTGSYTATTLGVTTGSFALFAPMLWLSIVFTLLMSLTGFGLAKLKGEDVAK